MSFMPLAVFCLFLLGGLVSIFGVWTFFIVKNHIVINCRSEFFLGTVFCSVQFLEIQRGKELLHNRIVVWNMGTREGLCYFQGLNIIAKHFRRLFFILLIKDTLCAHKKRPTITQRSMTRISPLTHRDVLIIDLI